MGREFSGYTIIDNYYTSADIIYYTLCVCMIHWQLYPSPKLVATGLSVYELDDHYLHVCWGCACMAHCMIRCGQKAWLIQCRNMQPLSNGIIYLSKRLPLLTKFWQPHVLQGNLSGQNEFVVYNMYRVMPEYMIEYTNQNNPMTAFNRYSKPPRIKAAPRKKSATTKRKRKKTSFYWIVLLVLCPPSDMKSTIYCIGCLS